MENDFIKFRTILLFEEAKEIQAILEEHGIEVRLRDDVPFVDTTLTGRTGQNEIEIQIKPENFEKANKALSKHDNDLINDIDPSHYLFEFSDLELLDILDKPFEWSSLDYSLSIKILKDRGHTIDKKLLEKLKGDRLDELSAPDKDQKFLIFIGYILAFTSGFLGVIIGYTLLSSKKTLPNGEKVFRYSQENQKSGKQIATIGVVIFCIGLLIRLLG
ncbi:MAG: hypothetical protein COA58_12900 [Bacteroidetes bacterium]|nr:MAG: hypothetical protein COA58_12900 [Bacteroidota bacterium]